MANMWFESVKHCVRNLGSFAGRDRPGQFWPYAGTVIATDMVIWFFAMRMAMSRVHATIVRSANASAPAAPDTGGLFTMMIVVMAAIGLVTVLLLAAAVVRRLHDRGTRGWWALLPVTFLFLQIAGMQFVRSEMTDGQFASSLFTALAINNIAYLISLLVLIVFLAWTSEPRENRYGPPPLSRS